MSGAEPGPAASEPPAAPATGATPARPLPLTLVLGVILVTNVLGLSRGLTGREEILQQIPQLTPALFNAWLAAPPFAIAGALGLWFLRRWGLYLIGVGWVIAVVVDLWVGATFHAILATGIMWLVVLFVRPVRAELR